MTQQEIEVFNGDSVAQAIDNFKTGNLPVFTSFNADDFDGKLKIVDAMGADTKVSDHLGTVIQLRHFVVHEATFTNEETGEIESAARTILIDDETGATYAATSKVIVSTLNNWVGILGDPDTWPAPIPVTIVEKRSGKNRYYAIERVPASKK